jgi:5-(carboxyamino)imidazole ribonucleotide synthase
MSFFSTSKTIGILGGGQLGKMLLSKTRQWDIKTKVLDPNPEAPSSKDCDEFHVGDLMDFNTVINFAEKIDILTIEIENVNIEALLEIEKKGVKVYPQPSILKIIQEKSNQKRFYKEKLIPTSSYIEFDSKKSLKNHVLLGKLSFPFIWKANSMGYDGYGVQHVKSNQDIEKLKDVSCIAEDFINIEKELAVIACRRPQGEVVLYPVVEMEFNNLANQVEYVLSPARISNEILKKATSIALKVSESYNHIGIMAIELFLTSEGEILVNEVAPRPHNSGHYSIEASFTSQFEQHIRAILDLPLGNPKNKIPGVMVNLVGRKGYSGPVDYKNINQILAINGVSTYIYGKKETRPFRKMGHVTVVNKNINKAREIAEKVKEIIQVISK